MKILLSTVIITYNEEKNIKRCLESVKDISDEIIIVDSFSTDDTEKICNKYNLTFIKQNFLGYKEQKNYALDKAQYNYVLSIDADEALSPQLLENIKKVKNNWQFDAYSFNRLTNFCGKWIKHSGWYPDTKIRLFKKEKCKWGGVNPHDKIILKKESTLKHLSEDLLHYSFYTIQQHIAQINKFSEIKAQELQKRGKKSNLLKIFFRPAFKFFKSYYLKLGFLDGFYGLVISINSAYAYYLTYVKLKSKELYDN